MIEKTNIEKIRECALRLLDEPLIFRNDRVIHPFTSDEVFISRTKDGKPEGVRSLRNKDDLEFWKNRKRRLINEADDAESILWIILKSYRLSFLVSIKDYLSIDEFSELLALTWTTVEKVDKSLLPLFKKCNKEKLMDKDELRAYQELPESITIFRGVSEINKRRIKGLSWTTDYEVAKMFAGRYSGYSKGGTIYQATIAKKYVYAFFMCREESEVIIDPAKLENFEVAEIIEIKK